MSSLRVGNEREPLLVPAGTGTVRHAGYQKETVKSYRDTVMEIQEKAVVHCVFIVAFDLKKGNIVAWQHPQKYDLTGVDFKALPSGVHTQSTDYNYFRHKNHFGLACFNRLQTNNAAERNARMCSVGVLMDHHEALITQMEFLANESRRHNRGEDEDHQRLLGLFNPDAPGHPVNPHRPVVASKSPRAFLTKFTRFWDQFGPSVFTIWRAMLLNRRVILFNHVPLGPLCNHVGWCHAMVPKHMHEWLALTNRCQPLFYVSVADMQKLDETPSFIACTTESIFKYKTCWDVYMDGDITLFPTGQSGGVLDVNRADIYRHAEISSRMKEFGSDKGEISALRYFTTLGDKLLAQFGDARSHESEKIILAPEDLVPMGLTRHDIPFLKEFIRTHNLNAECLGGRMCC